MLHKTHLRPKQHQKRPVEQQYAQQCIPQTTEIALNDHCIQHSEHKLELYCSDDNVAVCEMCCDRNTGGLHAGHRCVTLNQVSQRLEQIVKFHIDEIIHKLESYKTNLAKFQSDVLQQFIAALELIQIQGTYTSQVQSEIDSNLETMTMFLSEFKILYHEEVNNGLEALNLQERVKEKRIAAEVLTMSTFDFWDDLKLIIENYHDFPSLPQFPLMSLRSDSDLQTVVAFADSVIVTNSQAKQLLKWYGDMKSKWRILYRASRDGFESSEFHKRCDNKVETMVIVSAHGFIFGGYTPLSWTSDDGDISGEGKSWIFSITNPSNFPVKCNNIDPEMEICGCADYGPMFGNSWFIGPDCNEGPNSDDWLHENYDVSSIPDYKSGQFLIGCDQFTVTDYEVYLRIE